jgi:hypothetical protein
MISVKQQTNIMIAFSLLHGKKCVIAYCGKIRVGLYLPDTAQKDVKFLCAMYVQ